MVVRRCIFIFFVIIVDRVRYVGDIVFLLVWV